MTDADSSTNIFISASVKKGDDRIFFATIVLVVTAVAVAKRAFQQKKIEPKNIENKIYLFYPSPPPPFFVGGGGGGALRDKNRPFLKTVLNPI